MKHKKNGLNGVIGKLRVTLDNEASVDSELYLVLSQNYDIEGWTANPYFIGTLDKKLKVEKKDVLMVARLDGPTPDIVQRIIDHSVSIQEKGLDGTAYFDAGWPDPGSKGLGFFELPHCVFLEKRAGPYYD